MNTTNVDREPRPTVVIFLSEIGGGKFRLALDTGEFNFDIERAGKKMTIRADVKKKQT